MERIDGGDDGGPRLKKGSSASMQALRTGTRQSAMMELLDRLARRGEAGGYADEQEEETAVAAMAERRSSSAWGRGKRSRRKPGRRRWRPYPTRGACSGVVGEVGSAATSPCSDQVGRTGKTTRGEWDGWAGLLVQGPAGGYKGGFLFYLNSFPFLFF